MKQKERERDTDVIRKIHQRKHDRAARVGDRENFPRIDIAVRQQRNERRRAKHRDIHQGHRQSNLKKIKPALLTQKHRHQRHNAANHGIAEKKLTAESVHKDWMLVFGSWILDVGLRPPLDLLSYSHS